MLLLQHAGLRRTSNALGGGSPRLFARIARGDAFCWFFDGCAFLSEFSTMPSVMVQLKVNARLQHILSRQSCNLLGYSGSNALGMALFSKTIRWA